MNKTIALIVLAGGGLLVGLGLLFMCASVARPERLPLSILLIVIGGGAAAWAGVTWRRLNEIEPERLADRVVEWVRAQGKFETTEAEVIAALAAPASSVHAALEILRSRGEIIADHRHDRLVYVFPNLKESKVERRCPYCGAQFPVKQALSKCPNCGASLELQLN